MLDTDLAEMYGVLTKNLNLAVRRNLRRFPADFMFQLSPEEASNLRLQIATSSSDHGGRRYAPYAFTEHGVAMLSSVLRSARAIEVNIAIMRTFIRIRRILATNAELARKVAQHDLEIATLSRTSRNSYLRSLARNPQPLFPVVDERERRKPDRACTVPSPGSRDRNIQGLQ